MDINTVVDRLIQSANENHVSSEEERESLFKITAGLLQVFTPEFLMKTDISVLQGLTLIHHMAKVPLEDLVSSALNDNFHRGTFATLLAAIERLGSMPTHGPIQ